MEKYIEMTEVALKKYLEMKDNPQKKIYEAMGYSLFAGGKRLRPVIMLMTTKMLGKNPEISLPFAVSLEMIHTYSLIHDDLPSMDNDDLRRGMPTNHKVYGEAMAILAGDALLSKAFEIVADYKMEGVSDAQVLRAMSYLAKASGSDGMIGGQVVDIESRNEDIELLRYLHSLKTGALIRAAGVCGAILAGATDEQIKAIDDFCLNLGIAFQIQDDILDAYGSEEELGKPIGSDAENGKSTYITLCGLEKAQMLCKEYTERALHSICGFPDNKELSDLCSYLLTRRS